MKQRKPMNRIGKRTKQRMAYNRRLKKMAEEKGIRSCELKLEGCLKTWALSWGHSKKSRFIVTEEDWLEAALVCPSCHAKQESLPHAEGYAMIMEAINKRDRPSELFLKEGKS